MKNELKLKLEIGKEVINSYKRLNYTAWYAIAEFIDNSTQAYFNNKAQLDRIYDNKFKLNVDIRKETIDGSSSLTIIDNSMGMSIDDLRDALIIGKISKRTRGRSEFGMGMKTAAFWFGDKWEIKTKKLGSTQEICVKIDIASVLDTADLDTEIKTAEEDSHYTEIKIQLEHQLLQTNTISKCKSFLPSFFRFDIMSGLLNLKAFGELLSWNPEDEQYSVAKNSIGELMKVDNLEFKFGNGKRVLGWAAILENGSRKRAGFSLVQHDRVIQTYPNAFKPEGIFGEGGGRNDLINQRLFGELHLENFIVSHTKDKVIFSEDEENILVTYLNNRLKNLIEFARNKFVSNDEEPEEFPVTRIIRVLKRIDESNHENLEEFIRFQEIPLPDDIENYNKFTVKHYTGMYKPRYELIVGRLKVLIYIEEKTSPNDPYVTWEPSKEFSLIIIVNINHPYWSKLESESDIYHYLINIVFDGIAEWKAFNSETIVNHATIKYLKDILLRSNTILK